MGRDTCTDNDFHIKCIENPTLITDTHTFDTFSIYYCQRGRLSIQLQSSPSRLIHGDITILPPSMLHHIRIEAPYTVYFVISFSSTFLTEALSLNKTAASLLSLLQSSYRIYPKFPLPPEEIVFFECTINKIMDEYSKRHAGAEDIIRNSLLSLLSVLSRFYHTEDRKAPSRSYGKKESIQYCISYIDVHCCENITLAEIVRLSAMSKSLFCDLFKKQTGLSFKDYLNRKRIQKALALVKTDDNISEIAYACGYHEFTTFYRNFIKFTGQTPQQYRQRQIHSNEI